jgi:hypothetical protein
MRVIMNIENLTTVESLDQFLSCSVMSQND